MKKKIWKFPVSPNVPVIEMPEGAEILTVQTQHGEPCIWALVNPAAKKEKRYFWVFGTGHNVPVEAERKYIGTFQLEGGALVFHLFERIK
jgi:hypothetical protein